jgi:hypothetical protein
MTSPGKPRCILHPRDLVCPRCGAGVDHPCSFSGHVQEEIHCTERLLALSDRDLRVRPEPESSSPASPTADERPPATDPPKKRRPLPAAPGATTKAASARPDDDAPLTLFG